jgi:diketogulonate reductase-like aldo/keto reductase
VKSGRVRHVGVSNFGLERLKHAQELSAAPIAANQREYNLLERRPKADGALEYCQRNGILLIAYEPFGKGTVLGHRGLQRAAGKYGATPAQIALYWLIQQPGVVAIPMSANQAHLEENLGALRLDLPLEEIEAL